MASPGGRPRDEAAHSFGYWLRRRRKALDLTQEALARSVSCSRHAIRKIEADERRPSRSLAERLANRLAIPPEEREAFLEAARAVHGAKRLGLTREPVEAPSERRGHHGGARADPTDAEHDRAEPEYVAADGAEPHAFVGRDAELGLLRALLSKLAWGAGHVALIEGEPGIGKSRLADELSRYARSLGFATLQTRCYEIERAMAYQPVVDLVTQTLALTPGSMLKRLAPVSLAEIAALAPEAAQHADVPTLSSDFPEARQARLFHAIGQLVDVFADGRPLVTIVDDVQWADDASARFLHYFARRAAGRPLLVLLAYRDEDLGGNERLAQLLHSLGQEPHARRVPLARLRLCDTEALVRGDAQLAVRLHRETDGNPFFLSSMLHALAAGEIAMSEAGALPLPEALRVSVRARLAQVPAEARAALDVAAVLGRRFDFDALHAVTKEPEDVLVRALEMLVRRRLLREDDAGWYDFSHDKVSEIAYLEVGAARRMLLHRAVAETLEGRSDAESGERDARLAEHYERGHVWHEALRRMLLAAERAERLFALRDALHWLDRAVALAEAHPEALRGRSIVDLHERRGGVRAQAGQAAGAVADIQRVIDAARERNDRLKTREALIRLGMTYRRADQYPEAVRCLMQALAECRALADERHAADTLYHFGTVAWSDGRNREAVAYHAEAVAICERLGLTDLVAVQAYHGRGEAHYASLEPRAAVDCYLRSIELARGIGDKSYESENLMMVGYAHAGFGGVADYSAAEAKLEEALEIAERADLQWHRGPILLGLHHVRACTGRYGNAFDGMQATLRRLEDLEQVRYQMMAYYFIGELLLDLALDAEAAEHCDRALALGGAARIMFWRPRIAANRAIARARAGALDVPGLDVRALEREASECRAQSELYQLTRCIEALAEVALAHGDAAACLEHAAELLALAEPAGVRELAGVAHRLRGEALIAKGERRSAAAELDAARRIAREVGRLRHAYDAERALAKLGEAHETERWAEAIRRGAAGAGLEARV